MLLRQAALTLIFTSSLLLGGAAIGCGGGSGDTSGSAAGGQGAGTSSSPTGSGGQGGLGGMGGQGGDGGIVFAGSGGSGGGGGAGGNCTPELVGVVRDFKGYPNGHPDFEHFGGAGLKGIVKFDLGPDKKPVYAPDGPTAHTTGAAEFDQWYRDVEGVNMSMPYKVTLIEDPATGIATFESTAFFPIDNQLFGNEGFDHNYGFTYELHMTFKYKGGETFAFSGDDDLWIFVNNRLAIDLGGLHEPQTDTLNLDAKAAELGIVPGGDYALDFFHAERHSTGSNFKVQSTLSFTNCDPIIIPK
ncbi:fibro-slime domain-containing protein [Polyangium sorediatum]|uniref:Fibro-slime domain-containing protein n=1 Tax=Polyangium sorediatum TaxID=889274 RepID=A0ABT6P011_9BACT|nr:fibro-slime domain-containing protein [Polyangium sorediatum]MDI1433640.1 fibro-slime domain-containing protein [Polyangium sorediatum]